ncbi:hypothetical protein NDU88_004865 [Pleurodeles waltl]|uniref:Uncharacterized protein n=1 Tax=Pleurodeles waltl TaxID=8319 RepID=A0AAV7TTR0_PLEWA|nr:hypothetical protein NDU88_004865 [Pleurodeles waltl]
MGMAGMLQIKHDWVPKTCGYDRPALKDKEEIPEPGHQPRLTNPSPTQSEEGKKQALRAAASLMDPEHSDGVGAINDQDHDWDTTLSDSDSRTSTAEYLPHVTPQSSEDVI